MVVVGVSATDVPGATADRDLDIWIFGGLGGGLAGGGEFTDSKAGGTAVRLGGLASFRRFVLTTRWSSVVGGDGPWSGGLFSSDPIHDDFDELGVLAGYVVKPGRSFDVLLSAGVGRTDVKRVTGSRETTGFGLGGVVVDTVAVVEEVDATGFLLEAGVVSSTRFMGIGVVGQVNLNGEQSYGALTGNLLLGNPW
jgi:hypothetical protein